MYGISKKEWQFAVIVSSSHFAQHVYFRILPPLIPVLSVALEFPLWQLGLLITVYSMGMGISQAPIGVLADRMDRRNILPVGLSLAGVGYIIFSFAPILGEPIPSISLGQHSFEGGFVIMVLSMIATGIGLAVVHPTGYPLISDNVANDNKGKVLGMFGASSKLGDGITPAIIAFLIIILSWQHIILLFGVGGIAYGIVLYLALREGDFQTQPPAVRNQERSTEEPEETESRDNRTFLYPVIVMYFFFIGKSFSSRGIDSFFPAFFVAVYAFSFDVGEITLGAETVANIYFAALLVTGAVMQLYLGALSDRFDPRAILIVCMVLATGGLVMLAVFTLHPLSLLIVVFIVGIGIFGVNPPRDAIVSDLSPPESEGKTFGYLFTATGMTAAIFPTIIGYLLETVGMRTGYLILAIGTIGSGIAISLLYSEKIYREK